MKMSKLHRIVLSTAFTVKVERLETSFASASTPFRAEIKQVERSSAAFQKRVDVGEATWVQRTDDGYQYDYGEELSERVNDATDALLTLRKAFTFLIYHQWERLAQHWTKACRSPNHDTLVKAAKTAGVTLDEPGLEMLRQLVNTLKHNSSEWGPKLYKTRVGLFKSDFDPNAINPINDKPYTVQWADQIVLTDEHIDEFMDIVRNSPPR